MAQTGPFQTFDYGQVARTGELVKSAQHARDPANPRNRLAEVQAQAAERQLNAPPPETILKNIEAGLAISTRMMEDIGYVEQGTQELKKLGIVGQDWSTQGKNFVELQGSLPNLQRGLMESMQQLQAARQDPYTLGPGQARFQGGQQIASVAPKSTLLSPEAEAQKIRIAEGSTEARAQAAVDKAEREREAELTEQQPGEVAQVEASQAKVLMLNNLLDEAKANAGPLTTGLVAQFTSSIGGSPALNMSTTLDTIKANIGFDRLQEMRDNSKTGGALGQVSEFENRLLQAVYGSLEQKQGEKQFKKRIEQVRKQVNASARRLKAAYVSKYGSLDAAPTSDAQARDKAAVEGFLANTGTAPAAPAAPSGVNVDALLNKYAPQ